MKTLINLPKIFIFTFMIVNICFSQEKKINPGERDAELKFDIAPGKTFAPQREISAEEQKLNEQLMHAKKFGPGEEMLTIQKEIDKYAGSVTSKEIQYGSAKLISGPVPREQAITYTKISNNQNVIALAIEKEQIGSPARIWAVLASQYSSNDTIYVIYSEDNGNNWFFFSQAQFQARVSIDGIDAEIVQTQNEKYLYVVAGVTLNGTTAKGMIALMVNRIGSVSGVSYSLINWPGENIGSTVVRKYRPRITSDCALYQFNNAWIYIACCQDSIISGGYMTCVKTAKINDPYDITPSITKMSRYYYFNDFVTSSDSYVDLAYHQSDTGDQIMVLQSNVPANHNLYLTASNISNFTTNAYYAGYMNGSTTRQKRFGRISSNGYYSNLMITTLEAYSPTDLDIEYFKSTDRGISWSYGYIDYTSNYSYRADIMEKKNSPGEFYSAYGDYDINFSRINFAKSVGSSWSILSTQMNHLSASVYSIKPCFTNTGTDNCYAIWTDLTDDNLFASSGCSGSIVPNRNLQLNLFIQGRYNDIIDQMAGDYLTVQLRNTFSPYSVVGSVLHYQGNNGVGSYNFPNAVNGVNYYIVVKHRNSIETWSKSPGQSFTNGVLNYNFYTWAQAYGNNLVEVDTAPYRFGIYTGDTNQDGIVDITDLIAIFNDVVNLVSGYVNTDLTGNNFVDNSDLILAFNNVNSVIGLIRP